MDLVNHKHGGWLVKQVPQIEMAGPFGMMDNQAGPVFSDFHLVRCWTECRSYSLQTPSSLLFLFLSFFLPILPSALQAQPGLAPFLVLLALFGESTGGMYLV